jgi:recombination associated protein RdgC
MWFKNIQLFELDDSFDIDLEGFEEELKRFAFKTCTTHELQSKGWVAPLGLEDAPLVHVNNGCWMICMRQEEKVIPASMVKEMTQERIRKMEADLGKKLRKRERDEIKDDVFDSLVSRALTKSAQTFAYLDTINDWLIIDSASQKKADDLIALLRRTLGQLKLRQPDLQTISSVLTHWVVDNDYPAELVIEDHCQIKDLEEGGSINCKKQNLLSDEIQSLFDGPREVVQLALSWRDQVAFQLTADFIIKSIKFLEIVQDQANDIASETQQERFDADFSVMLMTNRELLERLLKIFAKAQVAEATEAASSQTSETSVTI